jgi:hypothetical protein
MSFDRLRSSNEVLRSRLARLQERRAIVPEVQTRGHGALQPALPEPAAPAAGMAHTAAAGQKRRSHRKRGEIPCTVQFDGLRMVLAARILDMSTGGARLQLPAAVKTAYGGVRGLPDRLVLQIKPDRMEYEGEIAWRSESEVGVRFTAPPRHMKATAAPAASGAARPPR